MDKKDISLLYVLKDYFGVGHIYEHGKNASYRVRAIPELRIIMNHFKEFPLITSKLVTFSLWSEVINLLNEKQHLKPEIFEYIITVYAALGRGASTSVINDFPHLKPLSLPAYEVPVTEDKLNPWWLSGYLTLYCSFSLFIEDNWGWEKDIYLKFRHRFSFSIDYEALPLAKILASFLGVSIITRKNLERVDIIAQSTEESQLIINFLNEFPLQSSKNEQYLVWRQYVIDISFDREINFQRGNNPLKYSSNRSNHYEKLIKKIDDLKNL